MNLAELRALAEGATAGRWQCIVKGGMCRIQSLSENTAMSFDIQDYPENLAEDNGNFIAAANPETVLKLITAIEKMRKTLKWYECDNLTLEKMRDVFRSCTLSTVADRAKECLAEIDELLK